MGVPLYSHPLGDAFVRGESLLGVANHNSNFAIAVVTTHPHVLLLAAATNGAGAPAFVHSLVPYRRLAVLGISCTYPKHAMYERSVAHCA